VQGRLGEDTIKHGARVRLNQAALPEDRPHLQQHARQGDIGTVSAPSKQSPRMAQIYIIVRFDGCGQAHRLLAHELEPAR
jgi:hypothetical protein